MSRLGIELLTVLGMPPVEHVRLAAELGCSFISTGLGGIPMRSLGVPDWTMFPDWSLEGNPALQREMKAAMRDTGVRISLGEGFRVRSRSRNRIIGQSGIVSNLTGQRGNKNGNRYLYHV